MYCYAVIYNSHSGHSNGELVGQKIEQALIKNQYEIELMATKEPKDATRLAQADFDVVIAGGSLTKLLAGLRR
ncbi:acylglycerol kinase family protein [Latilactobacillus sakei]|uniref:acylglycerol kinase family protein n=1 Tax=Latilactobacillus sakei TaxID=1599 RepID=UPI002072F37C|nr:acylglycerol kinase family protein [Latilactobacillus sakei]